MSWNDTRPNGISSEGDVHKPTPPVPRPHRVLLVDDHQVVRSGLRSVLESEDDFVVVGEAGNGSEAIAMVESSQPDLVLLDVRLPDRSGVSVCQEITHRFDSVRVLILTAFADQIALHEAVEAGASGYVLKGVALDDLLASIREVAEGGHGFVCDAHASASETLLSALSGRERTLAIEVAEGHSNRSIAEHMGLSEKTVKNYVSRLLTKLGMARRAELAAYVARVEAMGGCVLESLGGEVFPERVDA